MNILEIAHTAYAWATTSKDIYCERMASGGYFGEPLNLLSSLFFFLPAYVAYKRGSKFFTAACLTVAFGSAFLHSFANNLSYLMDVSAIIVMIITYYAFFFVKMGLKPLISIIGVASYVGFLIPIMQALPLEYSYYGVFPLMAVQFAMLYSRKEKLAYLKCLAGVGLFCIALAARFYDGLACASFSYGTHWLWHIFNSLVLTIFITCLKDDLVNTSIKPTMQAH